ncbi:MAG: FeoA family protein [Thiobacillus sp.]
MHPTSLLADAMLPRLGNVIVPRPDTERVTAPAHSLTLDRSTDFKAYHVKRVNAPAHAPEWQDWLQEIGFIAGERVMVMARAQPGGDPLVVRVGSSTFALRIAEAACVEITPIEADPT